MRSNKKFVSELERGYGFQLAIAQRMMERGLAVHCPSLRVRPSFDVRADYSDPYDIKVAADFDAGQPWHVEVKSRRLAFTSTADYPYPEVIVETKRTWDKRLQSGASADAWVIVSQPTGAAIVVERDTCSTWQVGRKGSGEYLIAPLEHFVELDTWMDRVV